MTQAIRSFSEILDKYFVKKNKKLFLLNDEIIIDKNLYIPKGYEVFVKPNQNSFNENISSMFPFGIHEMEYSISIIPLILIFFVLTEGFFSGKIWDVFSLTILDKLFGFVLGRIIEVVSENTDKQEKLINKKTRLIKCLSIKFWKIKFITI